jgi:hypothetical protein
LLSASGTDSQTVCVNTSITSIVYNTSGSTGIGTPSGLPSGVTANYSSGVIIISGTPTASGTFNYSIPLTGGCGNVSATGTITVNPDNSVTLTSASGTDNQTVCVNNAITDITYTTTGATGIGTATGLPAGVSANYSGGVITISGTPTASGTFYYSIPLTGGCGNVSVTGIITVNPDNSVTLTSASSTDNQTVCVNNAITDITYTTTGATGIDTATGLPAGVTVNFAGGTITISGIPTVSGTFNYSIPLTGGCGSVSATGTINVQTCTGIEEQPNQNGFIIYPNPNQGQFTIQTEKGGVFELIDMTGKVLGTYSITANQQTIQVQLPSGLYFIRETQSCVVQKFIIE